MNEKSQNNNNIYSSFSFNNIYNTNYYNNGNKINNITNNNCNNIFPNFLNNNNYKESSYNIFEYNKFFSNNNNLFIINNFQNNHSLILNNKYYNKIINKNQINNIGINTMRENNINQINKENNIQFFNSNNKFNKNINYDNSTKDLFYKKDNSNNDILNYYNNLINIKNKNIKNNSINLSQVYNFEDFLQYINSLPIPLVNYLCTSKGILEIQKKILKSNNDYKKFLIIYLNKNGLSKIMKNTYGNYFFQQIIKDNEEELISLVISFIKDDFVDISKDLSGTFSLQALLDEISNIEDEKIILNCIKNHELEMVFDKNATHVLQKLILLFPDNHRPELNEVIINNLKQICLDSNGICVIKNFIRSNTLVTDKKRIIEEFTKNFVILAESPFGNYGIQFLMENWDKELLIDIKDKIIENLIKLSLEQYSSNVIEKAIETFDEEYREKIIRKLYFKENFISLLNNKFGRFVLYKTINFMESELRIEIENKIIKNLNDNIYSNKDKINIKKFLMKMKYKKNENDFLNINMNYLKNNIFNKSNKINEFNDNNKISHK